MTVTHTEVEAQETKPIVAGRKKRWPLLLPLLAVSAAVVGIVVLLATGSGDDNFTQVYELNGTLNDELGGPPLVSLGGTVGAEGYTFGPNEGLALNVDLGDNYTIDARFRLEDPENLGAQGRGRYAKLVDYRDLTVDAGLYVHNMNKLAFFRQSCGDVEDLAQGCRSSGGHSSLFAAADNWRLGTFHTVRLVRDGEEGTVTIYLDGKVQKWSPATSGEPLGDFPAVEALVDPMGDATQGGQSPLYFMVDDEATKQGEALGGEIDYIRITIP